jgi:hypothetical protein
VRRRKWAKLTRQQARAGCEGLRRGRAGTRRWSTPIGFGYQLLNNGFQIIAEEPGRELVLGFVGRWWQRDFGPVDWRPAEFRGFDRPGYGVGEWSFTALPYGDLATVPVTEVRMRCTDEEVRRAFRRYYAVTGPFIKAMAGPVLTLVHKEAERTVAASAS